MTLQEAVRIYSICGRAENQSERTLEWVAGAARRLAAFAGEANLKIESIDADLIRKFIISMNNQSAFLSHPTNRTQPRPVSPETVSCYVRGLKALFSRLLNEGYINNNPMARIKTPRVRIKEPEILSEAETTRLFKVIDKRTPKSFRDYAAFLTLLDTGVRVSEMCALSTDDVDLDNGYLRVMGKGRKERFVPVGYKLTKVLLKYATSYRFRNTGSAFFFITREGNPLNRNRVAKLLRDYVGKAGIKKRIHPHSFRATKAVMYLRNGGDPFSLQKCLGHATLTMTRRYSAIADADVRAAHLKHGVVDRLRI